MKTWKYLAPAMALAIACSAADDGKGEATGTLSLPLTATDSKGELYRLRSASFSIEGYPQNTYPTSSAGTGAGGSDGGYYYYETVTTESDPTSVAITRRVLPGWYYVSFDTSQPWYIEHVTASGPVRVAESVLLSSPSQSVVIYDRSSSSVHYRFGVDGRPIDFRYGDLTIQIGIEHPREGEGGSAGMGGASF